MEEFIDLCLADAGDPYSMVQARSLFLEEYKKLPFERRILARKNIAVLVDEMEEGERKKIGLEVKRWTDQWEAFN